MGKKNKVYFSYWSRVKYVAILQVAWFLKTSRQEKASAQVYNDQT